MVNDDRPIFLESMATRPIYLTHNKVLAHVAGHPWYVLVSSSTHTIINRKTHICTLPTAPLNSRQWPVNRGTPAVNVIAES
jgi:hypothetical protein